MQPSKGINQDIHPNDLPEGFYSYAKNILCSPITNLTENEPGFDESSINTNSIYQDLLTEGLRIVGVISTTKFEVFWLTNNTKSIIGTYDQDLDAFTVIYDDTVNPKLNLNLGYPLKAVWRENFLGEIYVAWTDRLNKPRILNIQKASGIDNEKDTYLFPEFSQPEISFKIENGGSLKVGTYYAYLQYETNDGKYTDYSLASAPIYITPVAQTNSTQNFYGSAPGTTSKSIKFTFTNIDLAYNKVTLVIQKIVNGDNVKLFGKVTTLEISSSSTLVYTYTGGETFATIPPEDVLVKAPNYTQAATLTTLDSQLFLGNLRTKESSEVQKYVNNWKVRWVTSEVNSTNDEESLPKYSNPKSFAHDEVYALYAVLMYKSGKVSQAYHIPGRAPSTVTIGSKTFNENALIAATDTLPTQVGYTGDTSFLAEDATLGVNTVKYFHTRDTCTWNGTTGTMGYWENETEMYPTSTDFEIFDNTGLVGTLSGQKVRHHKFPSNSFIKDTLYSADSAYGGSKIDRLGIKLVDCYLPPEIEADVAEIIICHAKRTFSNSLVVSQDKTTFMGYYLDEFNDSVTIPGGWGTLPVLAPMDHRYRKYIVGNLVTLALIGEVTFQENADHLENKQVIGNDTSDNDKTFTGFIGPRIGSSNTYPITIFSVVGIFLSPQGNYNITTINDWEHKVFTPDTQLYQPTVGTEPGVHRIKLHSPEILKSQPNLGDTYLKLNYRLNTDIEFGRANNLISAMQKAKSTATVPNSSKIVKVHDFKHVIPNTINGSSGTNNSIDWLRQSENGAIIDVSKRFNFLDSAGLTLNQRFEFYEDELLAYELSTTVEKTSGVDSAYIFNINKFYTNVYSSFNTQDLLVTERFKYVDKDTTSVYDADVFLDYYSFNTFGGFPSEFDPPEPVPNVSIRAAYSYFIETSLNAGLRHTTNLGDTFYRGDPSYLLNPDLSTAGNYLTLNSDFTQVNEELPVTIFKDTFSFTNSFPHRIIKSLPVTSESKVQQWTVFPPLDYYEIEKSKGVIINLQNMSDKLLIHTERALFQTRDRATMSTDEGQVNLTTGEIFEFTPIEILPTNNGYTGTQHMFSCNLFREGYYWVDAQQGKVFCFNGQSTKELSSDGLHYFFSGNLGTFADNPHNGNGISMLEDIKNNRILMSFKTPTQDFTWSYSNILNKGAWVSSHSYVPDYGFSTRKNLFSFKDGLLFKHNSLTNKGIYYTQDKESSYIDVTFNPYNILSSDPRTGKRVFKDDSIYLNTVSWNTDLLLNSISELYKTFTHLTVWNQYQHSGRMLLDYNDLLFTSNINSRNAETNWSTNAFRDLVKTKSLPFIQDIFNNFEEIQSNIDPTIPWYEQERFNNRWFTVRFEYDNTQNGTILMHSFEVNKTDSYR